MPTDPGCPGGGAPRAAVPEPALERRGLGRAGWDRRLRDGGYRRGRRLLRRYNDLLAEVGSLMDMRADVDGKRQDQGHHATTNTVSTPIAVRKGVRLCAGSGW